MDPSKRKNIGLKKPNRGPAQKPPRLLAASHLEKQIVNPRSIAPKRCPAEVPAEVDVKTFVRVFTFDKNDLQTDQFTIVAKPDIVGTIGYNNGADYKPPSGSVFKGRNPSTYGAAFTTATGFTYKNLVVTLVGADHDMIPVYNAQLDLHGFYVDGAIASHFSVAGNENTVRSMVRTYNAGVQVSSTEFNSGTPNGVTPGAAFDFLAFFAEKAAGVTFRAVDADCPTFRAFNVLNLFSTDLVKQAQVEQGRVTALSVLATYTGNKFNDGGTIAAARVRPNYQPQTEASHFEDLAKLTTDNYIGPLRDGAYAWYLPQSIREQEFRSFGNHEDYTSLWIAGNFADADGTLTVTVACTVEFYSPLQIFSRVYGPHMSNEARAMYDRLRTLPAATCNPKSSKILKAATRVKDAGVKGLKWALANPELLASLLALAM